MDALPLAMLVIKVVWGITQEPLPVFKQKLLNRCVEKPAEQSFHSPLQHSLPADSVGESLDDADSSDGLDPSGDGCSEAGRTPP